MDNVERVFGGGGLEALAGEAPPLPAKASNPVWVIIHYFEVCSQESGRTGGFSRVSATIAG